MIAADSDSTRNSTAKQRQKLGVRRLNIPKIRTKKEGLDSSSYASNRLLPSTIDNFKTSNNGMQTYPNRDTESNKDLFRAEIYAENAIKKDLFHEEFRCFLNRSKSKSSLKQISESS
jgi:hypothetical protein